MIMRAGAGRVPTPKQTQFCSALSLPMHGSRLLHVSHRIEPAPMVAFGEDDYKRTLREASIQHQAVLVVETNDTQDEAKPRGRPGLPLL